jgi:hypothetical protein
MVMVPLLQEADGTGIRVFPTDAAAIPIPPVHRVVDFALLSFTVAHLPGAIPKP